MQKTERAKVCTDRVLPRNQRTALRTMKMPDGQVRAIAPWEDLDERVHPSREVYGRIHGRAEQGEGAGRLVDGVANLKFVFDNAANARSASLSMRTMAHGPMSHRLQGDPAERADHEPRVPGRGYGAHEFGHAIGLAHEHQNPKGGIEWNEEVVIRECSDPPTSGTRRRRATIFLKNTISTRSWERNSIPNRSCSISSRPRGR
jgi:hypothetical protein